MRHRSQGIAALAVVLLSLTAGGCNKGPAEAALKAAEQSLEMAKPEIEKYTPAELASLVSSVQEARARFDQGQYTDALKAAQELPAKVQAALAAANERKAQLTASWTELSGSLPKMVEALTTRVSALTAMKKLPAGMDKAGLETATGELGMITQAWTAAADAFQGGDIPRAVSTAQGIQAKAEGLAAMLGVDLKAAAAAAPTASAPVM